MSSKRIKKQKIKELRHKKELRRRFGMLAIISAIGAVLSLTVGAYIAGYSYAETECNISHGGASAPLYTAFIAAIPYAVAAILLFAAFCFFLYKNKKRPS